MSTVTDEMVDAACEAFVGQWDGVAAFLDWPSLRADMRSALEAAETVRVKAESNLQKVQIPTSTLPEGFIPWRAAGMKVGPVAEGTVVTVRLRSQVTFREVTARSVGWDGSGKEPWGIIAYRIHKLADFRLEAGKYYIDARGERTRLVRALALGGGGLTAPMPGLFHDGGARVWKADGTAQTAGGPDLLALSSNQESSHE
ncbi:MAG: hypothetical protein IOC52_05400 [Methylobacterium sp.]|nr:hypothetical protein [Methylobacterium sp.]